MTANDTKDIIRALGRIEGDTKGLRGEFGDLKGVILAIEERVRKVERVQDRMLGYAAGAGAFAGMILAVIKDWLI